MNNYDFNNLEDMLKSGASDADIARAFTSALNSAKAADAKRRVEEAEAKKREAEALKARQAKQEERKAKAKAAADAMNDFMRYEGLPLDEDTQFTAEGLIKIADEAKSEFKGLTDAFTHLTKLLDEIAPLDKGKAKKETKEVKPSDTKYTIKRQSDDDIINDFLKSIFNI